jgi:23S rRNA (uracil1939-C5)-methyltransferase
MKPTVTIEKLVPGGQGIATLDSGKKAFIWNSLPGETVEFETTKTKSHYVEGVAIAIHQSSPCRIKPIDDCYLATSPWQIMAYPYELEQKSLLIAECFRQQGIENIQFASIVANNKDFHYRNKMEYSLYWDNDTNQIFLAFHQRGTHRKIPITQSSIEMPEIFTEASKIVAKLNAEGKNARDYQSIMLRCNQQGTVSGGLFINYQPRTQFSPLSDTILEHKYTYSPNGFFQINIPVYELALKDIQSACKNAEKVLDLYCGVGTIGLSVARDKLLTLVESNKSVYNELVKNCDNTKNLIPIFTKAEEALDLITHDSYIILDPPRAGLDPTVIDRLLKQTPPAIIYLSCNPITQARDIKPLLSKYQITKIQPYNFFPRTPHIENLVILSKI